jgi:hypothetical protein
LVIARQHVRRLSEGGDDSLGLSCTAEGLFLGRTPLIERRDDGYVVRPPVELERLLRRAYDWRILVDRVMPGLAAAAEALSAGNLALAQIAAVHLPLPELANTIARTGIEAEDLLIKLDRLQELLARAAWDEAEHPRTGTPPNPGWFAPRNTLSPGRGPGQVAAGGRQRRRPEEGLDPLAEVRQAQ